MRIVTASDKKQSIRLSRREWESIGKIAGWLTEAAGFRPFEHATFTYFINLDERGSFYADVRNSSGDTVFEIKSGNLGSPEESDIFEDGFMKDKNDLEGLRNYLIQLGIMKHGQKLIRGN